MFILNCEEISKSYGIDVILEDVSFAIKDNEKVGIVGTNGSGKSTLLKIIAGIIEKDKGIINKKRDISIGYLAQDTGLETENNIWEELIIVFQDLLNMIDELREYEEEMGKEKNLKDEKLMESLMNKYSDLVDKFNERGGYSYKSLIKGILIGLSFHPDDHSKLVKDLSGGQKTRVALAKLLLQKPDILLLDEPTNFLDLSSIQWLEDYLASYNGAVVTISHDRYFLDNIVTRIIEVENNTLHEYNGNYSLYVKRKEVQKETQLKQFKSQETKINKLEEQVLRYSGSKKSDLAKSRMKALEKIDKLEKPTFKQKEAKIIFEPEMKSGKDVLKVENLSKSFPNNRLFSDISFEIFRGERVGLIGPNGIGKSTLLRIIGGKASQDLGNIKLGHNVTIGFYHQELENLNEDNSVLDEVWELVPQMTQSELRKILGRFLFTKDEVFRIINSLSGGEKARVALTKLFLTKSNFLLLDEPTNHLDIVSKEALEKALRDYTGTILVVSHDRYFLDEATDRIIEIEEETVKDYLGNYSYYREKKSELLRIKQEKEREEMQDIKVKASLEKKKQRKQINKEKALKERIADIEEEILYLEKRKEELEKIMCDPKIFSNPNKSRETNMEYNETKEKINLLYDKWEELA